MRRVLTRTEKETLLVNKLSELEVRWGRKPIYDRSEIPWIAHSSDEEIEKAIKEKVLAPLDHLHIVNGPVVCARVELSRSSIVTLLGVSFELCSSIKAVTDAVADTGR